MCRHIVVLTVSVLVVMMFSNILIELCAFVKYL